MTTYFTAKCHCGLNHFKIALETQRLPYVTDLCHCSSCRHSTGQLCINDVFIKGVPLKVDTPDGIDELASLDGLIKYQSSQRATRYSCKKCFAHWFFVAYGKDWGLFTGLLEKEAWGLGDEDGSRTKHSKAMKIVEHLHIESTLDGGMADHVREIDGRRLLRHPGYVDTGEIDLLWKDNELKGKQATTHFLQEESLPFYCQCRTITFKLIRPTTFEADGDDKLIKGSGSDDPVRFHASHCVCTSCRLTCGSHVASWICARQKYIVDSSTLIPLDLDHEEKRPKGLVQYESSPGVFREGCGTCGASIFYWSKKYEWIDICAGLVDEDVDGVRAESWVCWSKEVDFAEDAVEPGIVRSLKDGRAATLDRFAC